MYRSRQRLDSRIRADCDAVYSLEFFYVSVSYDDNDVRCSVNYICRDYLGSITHVTDSAGTLRQELSYDAWGRLRNPSTHALYPLGVEPWPVLGRGFTGHEYLPVVGIINMNARLYDSATGRFLSPDPYVQMPDFSQNFNRYSYCMNNPLRYTDPTGEFITWSISKRGFSIGINFALIGIPLGFGISVGWSEGGSAGVYGEVGYRVGGTGLGTGATISQSLDYGFGTNSWSTTTGIGAYGSLGVFNAGANGSYTYNMKSGQGGFGWGVSAGINLFGNDAFGLGLNVGYGSGGWDFGIGGYYNPYAWKDNPTYEPEKWNDGGYIYNDEYGNIIGFDPTKQLTNNCYSYALDDIDNGNFHGLQPGDAGGHPITSYADINLDYVLQASISDGRVKQPNLWNKLGFGKKGYYSVYLVIDQGKDYHWYRQDKGGTWSHKPGITPVKNAGYFIGTPFANYGNYKSGGILLWIRK